MDHQRRTRVLAVASGKGGVGGSNIVANLAFALTKLPKNVLITDADLGLESLNRLLGLTSRDTLTHRGNYPLRSIPHDIQVEKAIRQLHPNVASYPNVPASRAFFHAAIAICASSH